MKSLQKHWRLSRARPTRCFPSPPASGRHAARRKDAALGRRNPQAMARPSCADDWRAYRRGKRLFVLGTSTVPHYRGGRMA